MSREIDICNIVCFDEFQRKEIRKWLLTNLPSDKNDRFKFVFDGIIFKDLDDEMMFKLTFNTNKSVLFNTDIVTQHLTRIALNKIYNEQFKII